MTERARDAWQPPAEWRTSETVPYAIDWVDLRGVPGLAGAAAFGRTGTVIGCLQRAAGDSRVAVGEAFGA